MAIIATLVGLLLPAVQKVREAAYRTECRNNLKNIATAIANYESTIGYLPTSGFVPTIGNSRLVGTIPNEHPQEGWRQPWGWAYQILPQLDQGNLYMATHSNYPQPQNPDAIIQAQALKIYSCPSRRTPTLYSPSATTTYFVGDFAANGGIMTPQSQFPSNGPIVPGGNASTVKINNLKGGASSTILVGEKFVPIDKVSGGSPGDDYPMIAPPSSARPIPERAFVRGVSSPPNNQSAPGTGSGPYPDRVMGNTALPDYGYAFGSSHPVSMNAVFGDGSVRSIVYGNTLNFYYGSDRTNTRLVNFDD